MIQWYNMLQWNETDHLYFSLMIKKKYLIFCHHNIFFTIVYAQSKICDLKISACTVNDHRAVVVNIVKWSVGRRWVIYFPITKILPGILLRVQFLVHTLHSSCKQTFSNSIQSVSIARKKIWSQKSLFDSYISIHWNNLRDVLSPNLLIISNISKYPKDGGGYAVELVETTILLLKTDTLPSV